MEYLHSVRPYPVIHGDLKVQNVLVGDGLVAKVCDQFLKSFYLINLQLQVSEKWQSCRIQSQDIKAENCTYRYFIHHVPEKRPPLFF